MEVYLVLESMMEGTRYRMMEGPGLVKQARFYTMEGPEWTEGAGLGVTNYPIGQDPCGWVGGFRGRVLTNRIPKIQIKRGKNVTF